MLGFILFWLIIFLYMLWQYQHYAKSEKDDPPTVPGALPLIGNAHQMVGDSSHLWNLIKDVIQYSYKVGGVLSASAGPRTAYVITDPDDATTVANMCLGKGGIYAFGKPWLGNGLVTSRLAMWKVHRKLLNPAFSQLVLDNFKGVFNKQARRLVKELEAEVGKGPFDQFIYTRRNALETICLTALGVDFSDHTLLNNTYVEAAEEMLNVLISRFQNVLLYSQWLFNWSELKKKQDKLLKILHGMADMVLQTRKAQMEGNITSDIITDKNLGSKFKPFLDLLLELTTEKQVLSDREIREHVDTMIVGGHDTSAAVLMFTLMLIGSHPEVQEKMYRELKDVFGESDRDVDKEDLGKLVYMDAVIKESMRVLPIVPAVARHISRDVKLKNCTLYKGRMCFIMIYGLHHHPIWGKDVEEFKPQRWLDPGTLPEQRNAFAGFSIGKRHCIGKAYALISLKTNLAHVMRHYKLKADWTKLEYKLDIMLRPANNEHYISLERR